MDDHGIADTNKRKQRGKLWPLDIFARSPISKHLIEWNALKLAVGVLIKATDADVANTVSWHRVSSQKCQVRFYHPQRNVSRKSKNNPNLTLSEGGDLTSG